MITLTADQPVSSPITRAQQHKIVRSRAAVALIQLLEADIAALEKLNETGFMAPIQIQYLTRFKRDIESTKRILAEAHKTPSGPRTASARTMNRKYTQVLRDLNRVSTSFDELLARCPTSVQNDFWQEVLQDAVPAQQ